MPCGKLWRKLSQFQNALIELYFLTVLRVNTNELNTPQKPFGVCECLRLSTHLWIPPWMKFSAYECFAWVWTSSACNSVHANTFEWVWIPHEFNWVHVNALEWVFNIPKCGWVHVNAIKWVWILGECTPQSQKFRGWVQNWKWLSFESIYRRLCHVSMYIKRYNKVFFHIEVEGIKF